MIVDAMTDNRITASVRAAFNKFGGSLGETGSVSFMFDRVGQIIYPADYAMLINVETVLEAGADNVESDDNGHEVLCEPEDFNAVREALEAAFGPPESRA